MKLTVRLSIASLVIVAAAAGNSYSKPSTIAGVNHSNIPGPTPYCNPFVEKCQVMR